MATIRIDMNGRYTGLYLILNTLDSAIRNSLNNYGYIHPHRLNQQLQQLPAYPSLNLLAVLPLPTPLSRYRNPVHLNSQFTRASPRKRDIRDG